MFCEERLRNLNNIVNENNGLVIYWMSRDQRVQDNWSLLFSQHLALKANAPLIVLFCLDSQYPGAPLRTFDFMINGLQQVEKSLKRFNIPFFLLQGSPDKEIPAIIEQTKAQALVSDFDPLKIKTKWKEAIMQQIHIPFYEVDAHNIVPCFKASPKLEFGAYTIRPKIKKLLNNYLHEFPALQIHTPNNITYPAIHWDELLLNLPCNRKVTSVDWIKPGEDAAHKMLSEFIHTKLNDYAVMRNDPTISGTSNLSPYLHFGQISAQRIALEVLKADASVESTEAYLEELIVRRELSDNFCHFNKNYDHFNGLPAWAQKTLNEHRNDERSMLYTTSEFEKALTHDDAWNAAQKELIMKGKMHGYMRMYWAKKY